ncbi:MAG: glycosyltransferase family 2 protein [Campylobacterales bacterium]|nr:glycosyltransferase family 2 protein [Campylobacterales bacterium]
MESKKKLERLYRRVQEKQLELTQNNQPLVTVVIPLYNAEQYIAETIESVVSQTYKNWEMLIVDDCSTDNSRDVARRYENKDNRIKLIESVSNFGGPARPRNIGIDNAKGEYIGFVDPDDWVDEEMYVKMYHAAKEENADIVMCSYVREFGTHSKEKIFNHPHRKLYKHQEVKKEILRRLVGPVEEEVANPEMLDAWGTVWSKIYKTSLIKENAITFTDLSIIGTNEDTLFNIQTCYFVNKFLFLNNPYYHYWRQNPSSITTAYKQNLINKWCILFSIISNFINEKNLENEYAIALQNRIALNVLGLGLNEMSPGNKVSITKKTKQIRRILNSKLFNQALQQLELHYLSPVWRFFYYSAKKRKSISLVFMLFSIEWLRKTVR